jgi:hypothetical protein
MDKYFTLIEDIPEEDLRRPADEIENIARSLSTGNSTSPKTYLDKTEKIEENDLKKAFAKRTHVKFEDMEEDIYPKWRPVNLSDFPSGFLFDFPDQQNERAKLIIQKGYSTLAGQALKDASETDDVQDSTMSDLTIETEKESIDILTRNFERFIESILNNNPKISSEDLKETMKKLFPSMANTDFFKRTALMMCDIEHCRRKLENGSI